MINFGYYLPCAKLYRYRKAADLVEPDPRWTVPSPESAEIMTAPVRETMVLTICNIHARDKTYAATHKTEKEECFLCPGHLSLPVWLIFIRTSSIPWFLAPFLARHPGMHTSTMQKR